MKVSVIVPVYNTGRYIQRCVSCLRRQTYQNLEIILVDDGSTDDSSSVCDSLSRVDDRIVVIHQKNSGPAAARKSGIEYASGDYLVFVDSDDWLSLDAIERCVLTVQETHSDIIIYDYVISANDTDIMSTATHEGFPSGNNVPPEQAYDNIFCGAMSWNIWQFFVKRSLFHGVEHPLSIRIGEDLAVVYQIIGNAQHLSYINSAFYHYYQREESATAALVDPDKQISAFEDIVSVTEGLNSYISSNYSSLTNQLNSFVLNRDFAHLIEAVIAGSRNRSMMKRWITNYRTDFIARYRKLPVKNMKTKIKGLLVHTRLIQIAAVAQILRTGFIGK